MTLKLISVVLSLFSLGFAGYALWETRRWAKQARQLANTARAEADKAQALVSSFKNVP